jgi:molybdate transport system substrate-binding protein
MSHAKRLIAAILMMTVVFSSITACSKEETKEGNGKPELLLFSGAGIRLAASSLVEEFTKKHETPISIDYDGSGRLLGKISSIQKGDLYMPGSRLYVDIAAEKDLLEKESIKTVAYFIPVILVQKGNPKNIRSLEDFKREDVKIGLGDERSAAVGKKAQKILKINNIAYEEISKNVVYKSGTVDELGIAIQMRNVDAVIIWDVNAKYFTEHGDIIAIPEEKNSISEIPIGILKASKHKAEAMKFVDYITSPEGRRLLAEKKFATELRKN